MKNELSELRGSVIEQSQQLQQHEEQLQQHETRWAELEKGTTWQMVEKIQSMRTFFIPVGSRREQFLNKIRKKS